MSWGWGPRSNIVSIPGGRGCRRAIEPGPGGRVCDLAEAVTLTLYRVVQEGLNNVAKHAAAGQVTMRLERTPPPAGGGTSDLVTVTIVDDGVGVDTKVPTQGLGLIGMRERVAALAGRLEVFSTPGGGFH